LLSEAFNYNVRDLLKVLVRKLNSEFPYSRPNVRTPALMEQVIECKNPIGTR